jgi:hypothetical protein
VINRVRRRWRRPQCCACCSVVAGATPLCPHLRLPDWKAAPQSKPQPLSSQGRGLCAHTLRLQLPRPPAAPPAPCGALLLSPRAQPSTSPAALPPADALYSCVPAPRYPHHHFPCLDWAHTERRRPLYAAHSAPGAALPSPAAPHASSRLSPSLSPWRGAPLWHGAAVWRMVDPTPKAGQNCALAS